jgi:alkylation response protein AidB-like acyl-CoA dehydrogenase
VSEVRDLLVATAHEVFGREGGDVEAEIEKSGLGGVGEEGDLGDVAAVIRVSAYHGTESNFADRVMPALDNERRRGALLRSVQIVGALERVRDLTVRYAGEREQFGQPLNRFQAVQQQLAELAGAVALAAAAVDEAVAEPTGKRIAVAKVVAGASAGRGAAIAHQVHGAIGFTHEHVLHRFTTRLWRWRDEFGTEAVWSEGLGDLLARVGGDRLWEVTTDG